MSEAERRNARPSRTPAEGTPENMAPAYLREGLVILKSAAWQCVRRRRR